MRIDRISVELRPRSSWEAAELGIALVRTHAREIWIPYILVTLPVFVVAFALCAWLDKLAWTSIVYWWLKPVFDRIPLFVVSRSVFGDAPTLRQTLAAQRTWGWGWMLHYLTWRRLGPYRSLYLPVDLLEGGKDKRKRRNVIGGSARGVAAWVTVVFANFELAFLAGAIALVPMFMPVDRWPEFFETFGMSYVAQTSWVTVAMAALYYVASTALEPFYVGAGFGLYLNRRTQLEAWDVELAFRRLRERLGGALVVAFLALGLVLSPAQDARAAPETNDVPALRDAMGEHYVDPAGFDKAVEGTKQDPLLHPVERHATWVLRDFKKKKIKEPDLNANPILVMIGNVFGIVLQFALWIVLGVLLVLLAVTYRTWWPWLLAAMPQRHVEPTPIEVAAIDDTEALPDDIAAGVRALWAQGRARRALAMLYRASVESMVARTGAALVPGATEAECLRASRALGAAEDRDAFARVVRTWQYAAYADRMPATEDFESLVSFASQRFGWAA
jgi:hypothetical protein